MKNLFITCILFIISILALKAQSNINEFKYILVPKQYEFQKEADSYQINALTKFLFNKANFTVFFTDEEFPDDLATDRCQALTAIVKNNPSFLSTKLTIALVNCNNQIVFTTSEGKSKEKDYKTAYHQAIRKAFESIEALHYTYTPKTTAQVVVKPQEQPAKKLAESKIEAKTAAEKEKAADNKSVKKVNQNLETATQIAEVQEDKIELKQNKKLTQSVQQIKPEINKPLTENYAIEGFYNLGTFGKSQLVKKENHYALIGGDEKFEFAEIYPTSKPNIYIIKWAAFKQPQLLELDNKGNLLIDSNKDIETFKRVE